LTRVKRAHVARERVETDVAPQQAQRHRGSSLAGSRAGAGIPSCARGFGLPAATSQFARGRGTDATDSTRLDFDQRPFCGIAQHSTYGE